ncbi:MAG: DUF4296 domain-containing protein [Bacteroidota bacterium]
MQKYLYLSIILLLFACAPEKPEPPSDALNQGQMSDILAEMHLADVIASGRVGNSDSINQTAVNYREWIYKKYHTNHEQFTESFNFYKEHPILMDSIYAEVITKLSNKETLYRGK